MTRAVALAAAALLATACIEPHERRPGLWLGGDVVLAPVSDWSFSDDHPQIFVETRTEYLLPHSVTTVCAGLDENLYVVVDLLRGFADVTTQLRTGPGLCQAAQELEAERVKQRGRGPQSFNECDFLHRDGSFQGYRSPTARQ